MSEGAIEVTVRDGRMGRDPAQVTDEGGEILKVYRTNEFVDVGDRITLDDGTEVEIIGMNERHSDKGVFITAHVGGIWDV